MTIFTIIIFLIILIYLYKIFSFQIGTYFLEKKINELQPSVIRFLNRQKEEREETLKKYNDNDKIVRMFYKVPKEIEENIENIKKDLYLVNNYEILKSKWMKIKDGKKDKIEMEISSNFVKYLECLLYIGRLSRVDVSLLEGVSQQQHISRIFDTRREKESLSNTFELVMNT